jgi:hypothetical protein
MEGVPNEIEPRLSTNEIEPRLSTPLLRRLAGASLLSN